MDYTYFTHTYITTIIVDRWKEAVADPTIPRWHSLAMITAHLAYSIDQEEPDSVMVPVFRGIHEAAHKKMINLQTKSEKSY